MDKKIKPAISVIMAAYNSEKYIAEAIESILNQTFRDFEFIIINDASTDDTLKIIKRFAKKDNRIISINNKLNLYATKSRNKGINIARGKYIAIMDSDDIALPERLQIQFNYLESHQHIFLVGTGADHINGEGVKIGEFLPITNTTKIMNNISKKNFFYHPTIMFKNEGDYYRDKIYYCEDYDFYLTLVSKKRVLTNIPNKLLCYRLHSDSVCGKSSGKQALFHEVVSNFYIQRLTRGYDDYNKFDPKKIINSDPKTVLNKAFLESEIWSHYARKNFKETRNLCKKYFNHYGYFNKIIIYYILTFFIKK